MSFCSHTHTQIGSRRVIQWAALIMVLQGVINKFGAIFIMIPDPVVGGLFCVMFGMITAFGEQNASFIQFNPFDIIFFVFVRCNSMLMLRLCCDCWVLMP